MANTKTLGDLITSIRRRADMEGSTFVSDAELAEYVNQSVAELHNLLVTTYEDYYVNSTQYSLPTENPGDLPDDFYKCIGVDFATGGRTYSLKRYMFNERNILTGDIFYRIQGAKIRFIPEVTTGGTVTLWYAPEPYYFEIASTLDKTQVLGTVDAQIQRGYEEYIVLDAAIKCLMKEESDATNLIALREMTKQRIGDVGSVRTPGGPYRIGDVGGGLRYATGRAGGSAVTVTFKTIKVTDGSTSTNIVADKATSTLELIAGNNIALSGDPTNDTVTITATGSASGEANEGENLGSGEEVYKGKDDTKLQFRTLVEGDNVTLTEGTETITIAASGGDTTATNLGSSGNEGVYYQKVDDELQFKRLKAGTGISLSSDNNEITIINQEGQQSVSFTSLDQTPSSLGNTGEELRVNSAGDALEFYEPIPGITVKESDGSPSVPNVTTLEFNNAAGFVVTDEGSGTAKVDLGSHWKELQIDGQSSLVPDGEENLEIEAGNNITLTTDTSSTPKKLTITASGGGGGGSGNAYTTVTAGGTTLTASSGDTLVLEEGANIDLTGDSADDKVTIAVTGVSLSGHGHTLDSLTDTSFSGETDAHIPIYDDSIDKWENKLLSGDVTMDKEGVTTIAATSVDNSMLAGNISVTKLSARTVSYGGVEVTLGNADPTPSFNLADATGYPAAALTGTLADGKLAEDYIKTSEVDGTSIEFSGGSLNVKPNTYAAATTGTTSAATFTCSDNESDNENCNIVFVDGPTGAQGAETDGDLTYNPSTGTVTALKFSGDGSALTGVSGSSEWTETSGALHPAGSSGAQNVYIGGTNSGNADIQLLSGGTGYFDEHLYVGGIGGNHDHQFKAGTGGVVINKQNESMVFSVHGSTGNDNLLTVVGATNKVGIGLGSSLPSEKLEVSGTVKATAFEGDGSALTNLPGGGGGGGWDDSTSGKVVQEDITDEVGIGVAAGDIDANAKLTVSKEGIALKALTASESDPSATSGYAKLFSKEYSDPSAAAHGYRLDNSYDDINDSIDMIAGNSGAPPAFSSSSPGGKFGSHSLDLVTNGTSSGTSLRCLWMDDPELGNGDLGLDLWIYFGAFNSTSRPSYNRSFVSSCNSQTATSGNDKLKFYWNYQGFTDFYIGGTYYRFGYASSESDPRVFDQYGVYLSLIHI